MITSHPRNSSLNVTHAIPLEYDPVVEVQATWTWDRNSTGVEDSNDGKITVANADSQKPPSVRTTSTRVISILSKYCMTLLC